MAAESVRATIDLLKTGRGQLDAALRMIQEGRPWMDLSRQILASIALLHKANISLLRCRMEECLASARKGNRAGTSDELAEIVAFYFERHQTG
ncbi:MAG: metal-sensing transcriptional repressor [Acidobacteria bacterium]|nr:metal-sensing transcriptional repressor [Acidobacteriota bacterium]